MLYHYTRDDIGAEIVASKAIKAAPQVLYRDMFVGPWSRSKRTMPVVWLSKHRLCEPVIPVKISPLPAVGHLVRFGVADDYPGLLTFDQWVKRTGLKPSWFRWMVATSQTYPDYWRLSLDDIPSSTWESVEILASNPEGDPQDEAEFEAMCRRCWQPWKP
jgi:hypothetical protein